MFDYIAGNKSNTYESNCLKLYLTLNFFFVDWEKLNTDNSIKMYLDKINMLLDTYACSNHRCFPIL